MSELSKISCVKVAEKNNCACFEVSEDVMIELIENVKIKAFAIQNKDLAKAILSNI